ncbi:MAG: aspartate carbamoyltransferase, partial [Promethearchaeota archaeon]
ELGTLDGLNIGIVGDLKYGRTVHSLVKMLSNYEVNLYFISPKELTMRNREKEYLQQKGVKYKETTQYRGILEFLDVLYMTRIQKERFPDIEEYEKVKDAYVFKKEDLEKTKDNFKLMHPLPRITEISPEVDESPKAIYFKQTWYGLQLRKALLAELLKD